MQDITEYLYEKVGIHEVNDYFAKTSLESGTNASKIKKSELKKAVCGFLSCFFILLVLLTAATSHGIHKFTEEKYTYIEYFDPDYKIKKIEPLCDTEIEDHTVYHLKHQYRLYDIFQNMAKLKEENFADTVIAPYLGNCFYNLTLKQRLTYYILIGINARLLLHDTIQMVNPEIIHQSEMWKRKFFQVETPYCEIQSLFSTELSVEFYHYK